ENDVDLLTLGLSTFPTVHPPPPPHPPLYTNQSLFPVPVVAAGKSPTIPPPFPWSTDRRATVHNLNYLLSKQISMISGDVYCKRFERRYTMDLDLQSRFEEIKAFVAATMDNMRHRAPGVWLNPNLPRCRFCKQENNIRPVIDGDTTSASGSAKQMDR
ncbi:hypothetical protein PHJA_002679900, partial [Phtheirospermum japonicum]